MAGTKLSPNTVVASPPVTMVMIMMLEPNQMVKRSRAFPWRSFKRDGLDGLVLEPGHFGGRGGIASGAHDAVQEAACNSRTAFVSALLRFTISARRSKTRVAAATVVMSAWS